MLNEKIYFYKTKKTDKMWQVDYMPIIMGRVDFSFDKKKIFSAWKDYPDNLTKEQIEIFNKEHPMAEFFMNRLKK